MAKEIPAKTWQVRAHYDVREVGHLYGPFDNRQDAEQCVVALAGRPDVKSARIEEVDDGNV